MVELCEIWWVLEVTDYVKSEVVERGVCQTRFAWYENKDEDGMPE